MTTYELAKVLGCPCSTPTKYLILRLELLVENTKTDGRWVRLTVEPLVASFKSCWKLQKARKHHIHAQSTVALLTRVGFLRQNQSL